jgi:branched-subunit amino acid aminotransferase/4-amino-4-deoxychorismate lyase
MNLNKLKGKLVERDIKHKELAAKDAWNCAICTVSQKLNGVRPITLPEANIVAEICKLSPQEYYDIFFGKEIA